MHILVTNDDGVQAPGLLALAQAMKPLGKVTVFAPDKNWSGAGHVKTLDRPLRVNKTQLLDGTPALMSDGAPSDCVALALLGLVKDVDLIVSGINPYSNIGQDMTYSGTVTAAMEAVIANVPGLAFSLASQDNPSSGAPDYGPAGHVAQKVAKNVIENRLPKGVLLNVNVPYLKETEFKGFQITRQGQRVYLDELVERVDPRGQPYYWIGGEQPTGIIEDGTDYGALQAGYVSITPLQLDLTAREAMATLQKWNW
ncbi:MAG: 5'/3'-nucleotidase SurE [Anaerolineae bacterium]|nr:5'/3'-nucleotidase SurE [Anaerolineae bacterium]